MRCPRRKASLVDIQEHVGCHSLFGGKLEITGMSTPGCIGYVGLSPRYPLQPVGTLLATGDWKGSRACSHCDTLAEMQTYRDLQGNYPIAGHAAGRSTLCHIRSKWQAQHGPILQNGLPLRFGGVAQHITTDTEKTHQGQL